MSAQKVERLVEISRAFVADPNNDEKRLAYLKATFNLDNTAALIVALADKAMAPVETTEPTGAGPSTPFFDFYPRGFENTPHPCLVVDDPQGGDPHILALLSVIYRPTDLQGLCDMANAYLRTLEGAR